MSVPELTAAIDAALLAGPTALEESVRERLADLGAAPLARLCAGVEEDAAAGVLPEREARAALHREVGLTCRVLSALARELAPEDAETHAWLRRTTVVDRSFLTGRS